MNVTRIANRMALFIWGFTACWFAMLLAFAWIFQRDGAPDGFAPEAVAAILAVFWLAGMVLLAQAMNSPLYSVAVYPDGTVTLVWQYPHKRVRKSFAGVAPGSAVLITDRDSDGDPYFRARLMLPDGGYLDIAEGHDRDGCERACERFRLAAAQ